MKECFDVQCNICGKWLPVAPPVECCGVLILDKMIGRRKSKMERVKWYLKQLLPLTYVTKFTENDKRRLCVWRMWLGRCFNVRYFNLAA